MLQPQTRNVHCGQSALLVTAHMESAFGLTDVQGQGKERE